jgi:multicomponent Na+:H+ antiporter subunit B
VNSGFLNTAGTIPIMNIAVGLEVLGGLSIIIVYMTRGIRMLEETE